MNESKKGKMGIVCAICLVVIVLGAVAGWQLAEIFTEESAIYGEISKVLEGGLQITADENLFFAYTLDAMSFEPVENGYLQTLVFAPMEYDNKTYDYTFYINKQRCGSYSLVGKIVSYVDYLFYAPNGSEYNSTLNIDLEFYNDRTELHLSTVDRELIGYLNQMTRSGMRINVISSPKGSSFESAGDGEIAGILIDKEFIEF